MDEECCLPWLYVCFKQDHPRFSMRLILGLFVLQSKIWISLDLSPVFISRLLWTIALECWKIYFSLAKSTIFGNRWSRRTSLYVSEFIFVEIKTRKFTPLKERHPHVMLPHRISVLKKILFLFSNHASNTSCHQDHQNSIFFIRENYIELLSL